MKRDGGIMEDEYTVGYGDRAIGWLGPKASSFTLVWLAAHRDRLRSVLIGGRKLSILIVYDTKGHQGVPHDRDEIKAMARIVNGPPAHPPINDPGP